jgi:hypothetical protein
MLNRSQQLFAGSSVFDAKEKRPNDSKTHYKYQSDLK